jgi:hypothetical protein
VTGYITWLTHPDNPATAATVTATSSHASYPISNVKSLPTTTRWRSTSAVVQDIEIDFGAAQSVDLIALVNHNFTLNASVEVRAGSSTAYAEFATSIPWREFLAFKWVTSSQSYRYWRIRITDTGNGDGYIAVGYLCLGQSSMPTFNFHQSWTTSPEFINLEPSSPYNVQSINEIHRKQNLQMEFGPLTAAEITVLRAMYTTVKRDTNPLILLPERDGTDAYFGRIVSLFEERMESQRYASIAFEEDSYGNRR